MRTFDQFLEGRLCSWGGDDTPQYQVATQSNAPPSYQQPYLERGLQAAQTNVLDRPLSYFDQPTYVPFSGQTEQALQGIEARASGPQPIIVGAQQQLTDTLGGDYLSGGNPAYGAMVNRAIAPLSQQYSDVVMPSINAQFSAGGRNSSGIARSAAQNMAANNYMRQVGDISGNLAYQNYGAERQNQMGALGLAPGVEQMGYMPYQQLGQVGSAREGLAGQQLQDQMNRYNFAQMEPTNRTAQFMSLASGGGFGGTTTTSTPVQRSNPWMTGLGAASGLAGIGASLFSPMGLGLPKFW